MVLAWAGPILRAVLAIYTGRKICIIFVCKNPIFMRCMSVKNSVAYRLHPAKLLCLEKIRDIYAVFADVTLVFGLLSLARCMASSPLAV